MAIRLVLSDRVTFVDTLICDLELAQQDHEFKLRAGQYFSTIVIPQKYFVALTIYCENFSNLVLLRHS